MAFESFINESRIYSFFVCYLKQKVLIQMMVAAETGRDLVYFTFNSQDTYQKLEKILGIVKSLNVGQVYELIGEYNGEIGSLNAHEIKNFGLAEFLEAKFSH